MSKSLKKIGLFLVMLCFSIHGNAYHIIGGEIYYECMGIDPDDPSSKLYRFILKIYRDCAGGGQDFDSLPGTSVGTVTIYQGDNTTPYITTLNLSAPDITWLQADAGNPCLTVPPNICVQEGIYEFDLSLPVSSEPYHITYQRCCRNSSITNIYTPDETGATYTVALTKKAQTECNNSPVFNNFPPIIVCVNQALNFDHSATDADGDQLVYAFCTPLKGGGLFGNATSPTGIYPNPDEPPPYNGVDFILPNYSSLTPLAGNPVVSINPFTGLITGVPEIQGQFVVGICVKEYRNGELLSTIQRDFQFNVAYCEPTVIAELEGFQLDEVYVFQSCGDSTFSFENLSYQSQFIDEYAWYFDINGQDWISSNPEPTITFPGPGAYNGIMVLNPGTQCSDTAVISVLIAAPVVSDFEFEYDTCVAGPVVFTNLANAANGSIVDYLWSFGDGITSIEPDPIHEYEDPGLFNVQLTVTDDLGCSAIISQQVTWFPVPPVIIIEPSSFVGCPPAAVEFVNLSYPIDETYDIRWDFGDGVFDSIISPTHVFETVGLFDVNIEITSPIGCFTSRQFLDWIFIDSLPIADFSFSPDKASNFEPEVVFTDESIRAVEWEWTFDEYGSTLLQNPTYVFPDTGLMEVQLVVTHIYGCLDTIIHYVDVEPQITYFLPNAFTPNEDGINEFFRGGGFFRGIRDFDLKIMNRWGGIVFESTDPSEGWNGMKNNTGRLSKNGVYLVYVKFTGPRGMPQEYKGYATLIR
jgi:gliding motility-associated-like protein